MGKTIYIATPTQRMFDAVILLCVKGGVCSVPLRSSWDRFYRRNTCVVLHIEGVDDYKYPDTVYFGHVGHYYSEQRVTVSLSQLKKMLSMTNRFPPRSIMLDYLRSQGVQNA